jgi:hypothetical protein
MTTITLPPLPEAASPEWPFSAADEAIIRADRLAVAQAVREACARACDEIGLRVQVDYDTGRDWPVIKVAPYCADAIRAIKIEGANNADQQ